MLLLLLAACTADPDPVTEIDPEVVTLTTRDGVDLVADFYDLSSEAKPGVVLLHMTPAGPWSREDWPATFIDRLTGLGFMVIAVDRRGAGDSEGEAQDAFDGDAGRYDVEACVEHLADHGLTDLGVVGASNGTTSMVDYAVWAGGEGLPEVSAMGFMTGGAYTENQTDLGEVPGVPAVFTYSTAERDWSVDQQALDPGSWVFHEYADGDHGTLMFEAAPEVEQDLEAFFDGKL